MKRLYLLRHAKAVPGTAGGEDAARALLDRGAKDAPAMGRAMLAAGYVPDLVYCSAARRTVETAELVLHEMRHDPPLVEYLEALYLAPAAAIAAIVRAAPDTCDALMIVGHNPGLEECASRLAREPVRPKERDALDAIEENFPTGALVVLDFAAEHWDDVRPGMGKLVAYIRPRDL